MSAPTDAAQLLPLVLDTVRPFAAPGAEIDADTPLMDPPLIDSLNIVQIILHLESRLGFKLGATDITMDHFRDCRQIAGALAAVVARRAS